MAHRFIIDDQTGQLYKDFTGRRLTSAAEVLKAERGLAPTFEIFLINVASDTGAVTTKTLTNAQLSVAIGSASKPPETGIIKATWTTGNTVAESIALDVESLTPEAIAGAFNTDVYIKYLIQTLEVEQIGLGKYLITTKNVGTTTGSPSFNVEGVDPPTGVEVTQITTGSATRKSQWIVSLAQLPVASIAKGSFSVLSIGSFSGLTNSISLSTTGMLASIGRGQRDFEFSIVHNNQLLHRSQVTINESLDPTASGTVIVTSPNIFTLGSNGVLQGQSIALSGGLTYDGTTLNSPHLQLTGGTMSGAVAMGSNKISGLADGTASGDAVNKSQLDALVANAPDALNTLNELADALGNDASFSTNVTNSIAGKLPLAGGTMTGALNFGDNINAQFGDSQQLKIYHNGANNAFIENTTAYLVLESSNIILRNTAGNEDYAKFIGDGAVELYHNNSKKFETTSLGVKTNGLLEIVAGALQLDSAYALQWGNNNNRIWGSSGNNYIVFETNGTEAARFDSTGCFGINQPSPSSTYKLDVGGSVRLATAAPSLVFRETDSSNQEFSLFGLGGNFYIRDITNSSYPFKVQSGAGNDTLVINSDSQVGIGGTPSYPLVVKSTSASHQVVAVNRPNSDTAALFLGNNSGLNGIISANNSDLLFGKDFGNTFFEGFRLDTNGHLIFASTNYGANTSEDYFRIKFENVGGTANDVGIGQSASGSMDFNINPSGSYIWSRGTSGETMRLNSTGLGIGEEPSEKLTVDGNIRLGDGGARDIIGPTNESLRILANPNSTNEGIIFSTDGGTTTEMFIQDGGNVGISSTNPQAKLEINGGTGVVSSGGTLVVRQKGDTFNDGIALTSSHANSHRIWKDGNSTLFIGATNDPDAFAQTLDGKIGIGTGSTVNANLHVKSTGNGEIEIERASGALINLQAQSAKGVIGTDSNHALDLKTNGGTRISIDTNGLVTFNGTGGGALTIGDHIDLGDDQKIRLGSSDDLVIKHVSDNSYIDNLTGHLYITNSANDSDIVFRSDDGAGSVAEYFRLDGSFGGAGYPATLFPNDSSLRFGNGGNLQIINNGTDSFIQENSGDLYIRQSTDDKDIIFQSDDGSGGVTQYIRLDGSAGQTQIDKDLALMDSVKLKFGVGSDFQIFHSGTNTTMLDQGTGALVIASNNLRVLSANQAETLFEATEDGAVELYHNNVKKIETTSAGATVSGDLTVTGDMLLSGDTFTVDVGTLNVEDKNIILGNVSSPSDTTADGGGITLKGASDYTIAWNNSTDRWHFNQGVNFLDNNKITLGTGNDLSLWHSGSHSYINNDVGDLLIYNNTDDGKILFYSDDGSGGVAEYFRIDGAVNKSIFSANAQFQDNVRLYLGSSADLQLWHDASSSIIQNNTGHLDIKNTSNDADVRFYCDDGSGGLAEYFRLDGGLGYNVASKSILFADGVSGFFGNGGDLNINHDGTDTKITNGTGDFYIRQFADDKDIIFQSDDGSGGYETYFYLDGSISSGDPFTVFPDSSRLAFGTNLELRFVHDGSNSYISQTGTGNLYIQNFNDDKDIVFQCDDGSGSVETYFRLDGSASNGNPITNFPDNSFLSFGSSHDFSIYHDSSNTYIANSTNDLYIQNNADNKNIIFRCDDGSGGVVEYFRLNGGFAAPVTIFPDNSSLSFGANTDFSLYHDGSNSYINQTGTGNLIIRTNTNDGDIIFQSDNGSGGTETYFYLDGSVSTGNPFTIFPTNARCAWGNSAELQITHIGTDSYIANYTGDLYVTNNANDKDIIFQCDDGSNGVETYFFLDGSASSGNPITIFPDMSFLSFGSDNDLQIVHTGSQALFTNYTGDLTFTQQAADSDIIFQSDDGSGGIETYFFLDGSSSSGTPYTTFPDSSRLTFGSSRDLQIMHNGTNTVVENLTGNLTFTNYADDKDIIFQCDDGSGGTTEYFYLDGSAGNIVFGKELRLLDGVQLQLGTTNDMQVTHNGAIGTIQNATGDLQVKTIGANSDMIFYADDGSGSQAMYFTLDGGREVVHHHRGVEYALTQVSNSNYTVTSEDYCIIMHSLTASKTITIPTAQRNAGRVLIIKDRDAQASMYNIVIDPESSVTIDGSATHTISTNRGSVTLISDGSNWFVV